VPPYRCPVCAQALDEDATSYSCASGHHYDRAREGSVNLLRGGRLKGREHGDDDAMIRARRAVFDAGVYAPLIDAVAAAVAAERPRSILDVGCGEGTYLRAAVDASACDGWGIDISKPAVRLAAKRSVSIGGRGSVRHAVASAADLPFFDDAFDVVVSVFSPREFAEMSRVLRPTGVAIVATPSADHLREVVAAIYDRPRRHDETVHPCTPIATTRVTADVDVPTPDLRRSLLTMTPYWWTATPERVAEFVDEVGTVRLDVRIDTYRFGAADER
jgi:23S rRNA (guanine745-N1)-methyltransferase